jgi:hypothetical protein
MILDQREDDTFLRQLVLSEEDRRRRHPATEWTGGFRWFRSPNIIQLELYRSQEETAQIRARLLRK